MPVDPKRDRERLYSDEPICLDGRGICHAKELDRRQKQNEILGPLDFEPEKDSAATAEQEGGEDRG